MIKDLFVSNCISFSSDKQLIENIWQYIEKQYNEHGRYYHNLTHVADVVSHLMPFKNNVSYWETLVFSAIFHDVVYQISEPDNEEKSAEAASKYLRLVNFPEAKIELCKAQILMTKIFYLSNNKDTNLFVDADRAILGETTEKYEQYAKLIRLEYGSIPDEIYRKGRIQVLENFLKMIRIYKSDEFFNAFENQARKNMSNEINYLKSAGF
jgi:predicted metal-dependent HD superfamily phosphohydrolase